MDELYANTLGIPPVYDLSNNAGLPQSTPGSYSAYPNKPKHNQRENDNNSSGVNMSALELAMRRTRAARFAPLSSEKGGNYHLIPLMQNESETNSSFRPAGEYEGKKSVEEPYVVNESWCCCCCKRNCSCIYDLSSNSPHRGRNDDGFVNRGSFYQDSRGLCNCSGCCWARKRGLCPQQDDYHNEDVIKVEINFGHVLSQMNLWLNSAIDWAIGIFISSATPVGESQHWDDEVD
jgi:hypothetical protein